MQLMMECVSCPKLRLCVEKHYLITLDFKGNGGWKALGGFFFVVKTKELLPMVRMVGNCPLDSSLIPAGNLLLFQNITLKVVPLESRIKTFGF